MHGMAPDEELDYWRDRAKRAERERDAARLDHLSAIGQAAELEHRLTNANAVIGDLQRAMQIHIEERDAANRELERWRHGVTIEGDFVCPNELEATNIRAENERLRAEVERAERSREHWKEEARVMHINRDYWRERTETCERERDGMRAVFEAAVAWRSNEQCIDMFCDIEQPVPIENRQAEWQTLDALRNAIDSTLSPKGDGRG